MTLDPNGYVEREYNTTLASLKVLEGLETDPALIEQYPDILEQWRKELFDISVSDEDVAKAVSDYLEKNDDIATTDYVSDAISAAITGAIGGSY